MAQHPSPVGHRDSNRAEAKRLVERAFQALNERDREAFVALHHPDVVLHTGGEERQGIKSIAEAEFAYFDALDDLATSPASMIAEGDLVGARWTLRGRHTGTFRGVAPTGREVETTASGFFRVRDGKIEEVWIDSDRNRLLRQIGAIDCGAFAPQAMARSREMRLDRRHPRTRSGEQPLRTAAASSAGAAGAPTGRSTAPRSQADSTIFASRESTKRGSGSWGRVGRCG